jgi:uncharacterized protein (DUF1499 family)
MKRSVSIDMISCINQQIHGTPRPISHQSMSPTDTRRTLLLKLPLLSLAFTTSPPPQSASAAPLPQQSSPYQRAFNLEYGLDASQRIRQCPSGVNPNCVGSSSSNSSSSSSPAWETFSSSSFSFTSRRQSPDEACDELETALSSMEKDTAVVERTALDDGKNKVYVRFRIPDKAFKYDYLEFLIARQGSSDRSDGEPLLVTYRSMAAEVKYIYPFQVPITDFGQQRKRIKALRSRLGWRIAGVCDLVECYSEE